MLPCPVKENSHGWKLPSSTRKKTDSEGHRLPWGRTGVKANLEDKELGSGDPSRSRSVCWCGQQGQAGHQLSCFLWSEVKQGSRGLWWVSAKPLSEGV